MPQVFVKKEELFKYLKEARDSLEIQRIHIAEKMPLPKDSSLQQESFRLTLPLSGSMWIESASEGRIFERVSKRGDALFYRQFAWGRPVKVLSGTSLGLVYRKEILRVVHTVNIPEKQGYSNIMYHTSKPPGVPIIELLRSIDATIENRSQYSESTMKTQMKLLISMTLDELSADIAIKHGGSYRTWQQLNEYLIDNFHRPINRHVCARENEFSPGYVSNIFKKHSNISFNAHLNELRMEKAIFLLRQGNIPVKTVAFQCGFSNYSYFVNAFKKHFGVSPGRYKFAKKSK